LTVLRFAPLAALAALLALFLPASGPPIASGTSLPALPPGQHYELKIVIMTCPSWFGQRVEQVTGLRGLTLRQEILPPVSELLQSTSGDEALVCQWYSGRQLAATIRVGDGTVPNWETARTYLSREIARSGYHLTLLKDIPWFDAGAARGQSAAEFGTAQTTAGVQGSVWSVIVGYGGYEQMTLTCLDPAGAAGPVEALAQPVYNWWMMP
jgi:hypothetical protein